MAKEDPSTKKDYFGGIIRDFRSAVIGAIVMAIISLIAWISAYLGWTNLGLPQHFNYEYFDHLVKSSLPKDYIYTPYSISLRMKSDDSILVVGKKRDIATIDGDTRSDVILIVDKAKDEYKISYRFEAKNYEYPVTNSVSFVSSPLHVSDVKIGDLNNDGRDDIMLGWSMLGANYSPPAILVIYSDGANTSTLGVADYQNPSNRFSYDKVQLGNAIDNQYVKTVTATSFDIKKGQIALVNRTDNACRACGDEAIYSVQLFNISDDKITYGFGNMENINGYKNLNKFLEE